MKFLALKRQKDVLKLSLTYLEEGDNSTLTNRIDMRKLNAKTLPFEKNKKISKSSVF